MIDPDTDRDAQRVLDLIRANGWYLTMSPPCDEAGCSLIAIIAFRGDENAAACAPSLYLAACELADRCGIDLRDG